MFRIEINYPGMGNNSQFMLDPYGRNVKILEQTSGSTTSTRQFIWSGASRAEVRDAGGSLVLSFYVLGEKSPSTSYFYACDHLKSTRQLTDASGVIQSESSYDPFGRRDVSSGTTANFQFTGAYYHERSGLSLTAYRSYSASLGRWLSSDPIKRLRHYNYCANDPIALKDVLGLRPHKIDSQQFKDALSRLECMCEECSDDPDECKKQVKKLTDGLADTWEDHFTPNWTDFFGDTVGGYMCYNWATFFMDVLGGLNSDIIGGEKVQANSPSFWGGLHQNVHVTIKGKNPKPGAKCEFWLDDGIVDDNLIHWNGPTWPEGFIPTTEIY